MTSILREQPEAVRRTYWARHWACAVDVMELVSTEAASAPGGDQGGLASEGAEKVFDPDELLHWHRQLVQIINEQYMPGGQYKPVCDIRCFQLKSCHV